MPEPMDRRAYLVASSQRLIARSRNHISESRLLKRNVDAQLRASRQLLRHDPPASRGAR